MPKGIKKYNKFTKTKKMGGRIYDWAHRTNSLKDALNEAKRFRNYTLDPHYATVVEIVGPGRRNGKYVVYVKEKYYTVRKRRK